MKNNIRYAFVLLDHQGFSPGCELVLWSDDLRAAEVRKKAYDGDSAIRSGPIRRVVVGARTRKPKRT